MLRPERMSRISVTGSKQVLEPVIETLHELNALHLIHYDESWEGFDPGDPLPGSDEASDKLVTIRSIESILDIQDEDAGPTPALPDDDLDEELEDIRERVNALDDRRRDLRNDLRRTRDEIQAADPFVDLGLPLDLLTGYENLSVHVGETDPAALEDALEDAPAVEASDVTAAGDTVAVFVYPASVPFEDITTGIEFTPYQIPDATGSPTAYIEDLHHRADRLESQLETVEQELADLKIEIAGFVLAAEEKLSIDTEKLGAPLMFATTKNAFVAEGWIPSRAYDDLVNALDATVGDHVEIEELERASYTDDTHPDTHETPEETHPGQPVATDGSGQGPVDGPYALATGNPPVLQNNPEIVRPFELIVNTVNRPKYNEIDPSLIVFLTFPFAFGFMIGDIGYGILYMALGWFLYRFDSNVLKALGLIAAWAGVFTILFGYLYDDLFGVHLADLGLSLPLLGVFSKGLQTTEFALLWVIASVLFGILHLSVGFILGFINDRPHGLRHAVLGNLSWLLVLNGFFVWVFSVHAPGNKPEFLVGPDSILALFIGFPGFSETVGLIGLGAAAVGVVMVIAGEGGIGFVELPSILANSLSYLRIVAVLLAKGGMAFAVNLLVFGAYLTPAGYVVFNLPTTDVTHYEQQFIGLIHIDPFAIGLILAVFVFIFGHILVLLLGITAAGIQMVRLEFVEFFAKFYEGGGTNYEPFGYQRTYTKD